MSVSLRGLAATVGIGLTAIAIGNSAKAITVVPINLQDTIHEADAIFVGHVLQAQSRWGTPEHRWMVTDYTFAVDDAVLAKNAVRTGV